MNAAGARGNWFLGMKRCCMRRRLGGAFGFRRAFRSALGFGFWTHDAPGLSEPLANLKKIEQLQVINVSVFFF